jgi:hypothetical protein
MAELGVHIAVDSLGAVWYNSLKIQDTDKARLRVAGYPWFVAFTLGRSRTEGR